jgi:hypothetical protein
MLSSGAVDGELTIWAGDAGYVAAAILGCAHTTAGRESADPIGLVIA